MSGHTFTTVNPGVTPDEAFRYHDDDLAQKYGFVIIDTVPQHPTAAQRLAGLLIEKEDERIDDKWGPAGAIAVASRDSFNERTVTVTVDSEITDPYIDSDTVENLVRPKLRLLAGEQVTYVRVKEDHKTFRTSTERTEGEAVTRYHVVAKGQSPSRRDPGHPTVAKAREAMKQMVDNALPHAGTADLEVVGMITRGSEGLVRGTRAIKKRRLTVDVELVQPKGTLTTDSWLFFGWVDD